LRSVRVVVGQDPDVFMEQPTLETGLFSPIPVNHGQHTAHAAVIIGKLMVELGQDTAGARSLFHQGHRMPGFGQIQGAADPPHTGADHDEPGKYRIPA
jgi:hypothetical protein